MTASISTQAKTVEKVSAKAHTAVGVASAAFVSSGIGCLIVGVVLMVVWAVRQFSSNGQNSSTPRQSDAQPSPREIVEKRYARGELTREQYQEMLSDLS